MYAVNGFPPTSTSTRWSTTCGITWTKLAGAVELSSTDTLAGVPCMTAPEVVALHAVAATSIRSEVDERNRDMSGRPMEVDGSSCLRRHRGMTRRTADKG